MNPEPVNTNQGTVLVVDDETSVRRVLSATLTGMGFTVVAASRGQEAVELVNVAQFDAVLLDVDMPGMGGVETCRSIRCSNAFLPVLILTAMDGEDDQVAGLEAGADDYITKPFAMRELIARLRSAVRRKKTQDTNQGSPKQEATIRYGEIELDPVKYRLQKRGRRIHLTPKQFAMLHYLCLLYTSGSMRAVKFAGAEFGVVVCADPELVTPTVTAASVMAIRKMLLIVTPYGCLLYTSRCV